MWDCESSQATIKGSKGIGEGHARVAKTTFTFFEIGREGINERVGNFVCQNISQSFQTEREHSSFLGQMHSQYQFSEM